MREARQNKTLSLLATCVQLVLVALIVYLLVRAVITFVTPQSVWVAGQQSATSTPVIKREAAKINLSFDPFNRASVVETVIDDGRDAPETSLNLKLTGLRFGELPTAILQTPDNRQSNFTVGDEIVSGVTLHSIHQSHIVISQNGIRERLTLERDAGSLIRPFSEDEKTSNSTGSSIQSTSINARAIQQDLLSSINTSPVVNNGRIEGIRITPRGSVDLSRFGLQSGDVLTKIGSEDLTKGLPNLRNIEAMIARSDKVSVNLLRNGSPMTIDVKVK